VTQKMVWWRSTPTHRGSILWTTRLAYIGSIVNEASSHNDWSLIVLYVTSPQDCVSLSYRFCGIMSVHRCHVTPVLMKINGRFCTLQPSYTYYAGPPHARVWYTVQGQKARSSRREGLRGRWVVDEGSVSFLHTRHGPWKQCMLVTGM